GDPGAFEILYRKYYERIHILAKGILLDSDDAADTVQEIFTLVYRNLPKFDRRSRFSTWLFRVAVNRSIQQVRSLKFKRRWTELDERIPAPEVNESLIEPRVALAMEKLPPDDRAILTLFYWEELSLNEIAESMGIQMNAAKTRLYRARERFRHYYEVEA
ncbi:MAG: sigma-70 family RNA polymerase sigma factor, partial [Fimbriimonadaceae bacterium]